jgi:hypothetical protein
MILPYDANPRRMEFSERTGIALSLLLIAAYTRPFTGEISVGPDLLKQVITSETTATPP